MPFQLTNNSPFSIQTNLPPLPPYLNHPAPPKPAHTPLFVNTDYVCGLSQTLFVKLRILQQNIFGDNCCTVFVSSIFVYCYFGENNMHYFFFLFLFLLISCLFILRKCCMWLTWTVNKISKFWEEQSVFFFLCPHSQNVFQENLCQILSKVMLCLR